MKLLAFIIIFFLPFSAYAATATMVLPEDVVRVGDDFVVEVFLNTEQESINALDGAIIVSPELSLKEVRLDGSVISWWLTRPAERSPGKIDFAGVMPGGYQATPENIGKGNFVTLVLKAQKKGAARITMDDMSKAYLNDGEGTALPFKSRSAQFIIGDSEGSPSVVEYPADIVPPEVFVPVILSGEPFGIEGQVLVFEAHDKDTGIVLYELASSYFNFLPSSMLTWSPITSPHQIDNDMLSQYLFVRATDADGSARIGSISPKNFSLFAYSVPLLAIMLILVVSIYIIRHMRLRRKAY